MSPSEIVRLRILGLPAQMVVSSVPAVLRYELAVSAIDLVELTIDKHTCSVAEVFVDADSAARIREHLLFSFAAIYVEDVTHTEVDATARRTRMCSRNTECEELDEV